MSTKLKIAFACNLASVLIFTTGGLAYLFSRELMSYHLEVLDVGWSDLNARSQIMLLSFLKGTGLAALVPGIAMGILLFVPFQRGDAWARWAITVIGLMTLLPATYIAATLASATGASIPWPLLLVPVFLLLLAFILSGELRK